jgi:hypothetical protein
MASVQASTTSPVVAAPRCHSRIAQEAERQQHGDDGMEDAQPLEIEQALAPRFHLAIDGGVETAMFAQETAEGANQRHVGDDVDHLAVDRRGLGGIVVMQRPSRRRKPEHQHHHDA